MQMSFKLPEINREETRNQVEESLEKYQMFMLMDPVDLEPKVTASYTLTQPSNTNEVHSKTETQAVKKVEQEWARQNYTTKIQKAVNRLSYEERTVAVERYMKGDSVFDYEVYNELGYSERKYYRIKARAFYKLAIILRLEVYKDEVEST